MKNDIIKEGNIKGTRKKSLVPALRFPGFEKEWKEKRLEDIAEFYKGKGISKNDISCNGNTPCIRYGELYTTYKEIVRNIKSYTDIPTENLFLSKSNDVIIPSSGETKEDISTASCILCDNIALGGDINVIRASHHNGVFLSYYLNNAKKNDIANIAQGISIIHLHNKQLQKLFVTIPSPAEQQKIAACLSSIDEDISAIKEKVEQLKTHKKGLMQKLFPVGGKYVPEVRFPEFRNNGEWEEKELHEIAKHETAKNKENCKYPILTNSAIYGIVPQQDYFDREIVTNDNLINYQIVEYNDFVYNPRVSTKSPVGPISRNKICMGIMSPLYTIFRFKEKDVDYFECYFETDVWHEFIKKKANYGARFDRINISTDDFFSLPIQCPSPDEQQKIAVCLSSAEKLISLYESKVSLLEWHKKGLMQQLFPKL